MIKTIGVMNPYSLNNNRGKMKRDLLFFDKICLLGANNIVEKNSGPDANEIEYLMRKEIVFDTGIVSKLYEAKEQLYSKTSDFTTIEEFEVEGDNTDLINSFCSLLDPSAKPYEMFDFLARSESVRLRQTENLDATPILVDEKSFEFLDSSEKSDIIQIAIKAMPIPNDLTAWEDIFAFKQDEESKQSLLALRTWITKIAKQGFRKNEIKEELEYLLEQYEVQLKKRKIKYQNGTLIELVAVGSQFVTAINSFGNKYSLLIGTVATILLHKKIKLLKNERVEIGKEIAYISMTREKFSDKRNNL